MTATLRHTREQAYSAEPTGGWYDGPYLTLWFREPLYPWARYSTYTVELEDNNVVRRHLLMDFGQDEKGFWIKVMQ